MWKVRPGGPLRGAPTVANGAVYVMSQDNQIYSLKEADGSTNWSQAGLARNRRRVRLRFARGRPGNGRRRLLVGRAQRLSLREWPPGVAGRAAAHQHPHQRVFAHRHRRRPGNRQRPGDRRRPGRPHGRARSHHRPAPVGAQHRRHLDAMGRGRLDFRRHRRCQADLRLRARTATSAGSTSCRSSARPSRRRARSTIRARCSLAAG